MERDSQWDLVVEEALVQAGESELDRFRVHRIAPADPQKIVGTIILLPTGSANFDAYDLDVDGRTFARHLAALGIEVFGYSPRPGSMNIRCKKRLRPFVDNSPHPVGDCSTVRDWGLETYLQDIDYLVRQVEATGSGRKPAIGGHSLGAILSIAAANRWPDRFSGLLIWEGMLTTDNQSIRRANLKEVEKQEKRIKMGNYAPIFEIGMFKRLSRKARSSPKRTNLLGLLFGLPVFSNNREVFIGATLLPMNDPPLFGSHYHYLAGDREKLTYRHIREETAHRFVDILNYFDPAALSRDIALSLGGKATGTVDHLGEFAGKVLVLGAELGFGSEMEWNTGLLTRAVSIETIMIPEAAHVDTLLGGELLHKRVAPTVAAWLAR